MGLDAQVIAIGPFSQDVVEALEYPPGHYGNVQQGDVVVTNVFVASTSADSHALAKAFDIGAWELGSHHLRPEEADIPRLIELSDERHVQQFLTLRDNGFQFYYLPNG